MRKKSLQSWLMLVVALIVPGLTLSQGPPQTRTLVVNGQAGQAKIVQFNGHTYVDLESLARIANGSLGFDGGQITLTLPAPSAALAPAAQPSGPPANPGFSKEFMKAGIEFMSVIREWRSALINSIQNNFPVTDDWTSRLRGQAATSLRLASVAASTDSDKNAYQLLTLELDNMKKLSDKLVAARTAMNYVSPDDLQSDPLNQKILNCARSLASMASSGQFVDDGSCY
jgi:hypothetical protein